MDPIDQLQSELKRVEAAGGLSLDVKELLKYTSTLREQSAKSIELSKMDLQRVLAHYDAVNKSQLESYKSVIDSGREALNAALLVNGGAAVAILGFLGGKLGQGLSPALGRALSLPLLGFGIGVLSAALAFALRYFTQYFYGDKNHTVGICAHVATVAFAVCSYIAFGTGIYWAYSGFLAHFNAA